MPTGKQLRAARALVDWSADDLAVRAGVNRESILHIERGQRQPRAGTVEKIVRVLNDAGVEFNGERGVNLVSENFRVLEGGDCYLRLLDEVGRTLRSKKGAEVLSICTDDSVSPPEVTEAIRRWHDAGIRCRFLTHENATRFDFPLREYRAIPEKFYKNSVMVVYGDNVATLHGTNAAVTVVRDMAQADMLRGLFEMIWQQSPEPKRS